MDSVVTGISSLWFLPHEQFQNQFDDYAPPVWQGSSDKDSTVSLRGMAELPQFPETETSSQPGLTKLQLARHNNDRLTEPKKRSMKQTVLRSTGDNQMRGVFKCTCATIVLWTHFHMGVRHSMRLKLAAVRGDCVRNRSDYVREST